jgi:protein-S-isoprenylcysteine O-methyltransferase Ste14
VGFTKWAKVGIVNAEVDRARVVPAPVIFFGLLILGFLLNWVLPLTFFPGRSAQIAGVVIVVPGLLIGGSAIIEMRRAHTSPDPREPTRVLVERGVLRYTRNPLYLSMFVLFFGIAVFLDVLWLILLFPLLLFVVERGAVKPEESYLERKFGETYLQYRKRVPRWM